MFARSYKIETTRGRRDADTPTSRPLQSPQPLAAPRENFPHLHVSRTWSAHRIKHRAIAWQQKRP